MKEQKDNTVYADKGEKIKVKKCPHCKSTLIVDMGKDGTEVLKCSSCKFEVKK
jgi:hypothetical protein